LVNALFALSVPISNLVDSLDPEPVSDVHELGVGQTVEAGPSVYLILKSTSKIPASGAISVIGPRVLASAKVLFATLIL
jgi:hypothetical protein